MKTISESPVNSRKVRSSKKPGELKAEYRFDYAKARPNRFATQQADRMIVLPDPDVARIFSSAAAVNTALRAILSEIPDGGIATKP